MDDYGYKDEKTVGLSDDTLTDQNGGYEKADVFGNEEGHDVSPSPQSAASVFATRLYGVLTWRTDQIQNP